MTKSSITPAIVVHGGTGDGNYKWDLPRGRDNGGHQRKGGFAYNAEMMGRAWFDRAKDKVVVEV